MGDPENWDKRETNKSIRGGDGTNSGSEERITRDDLANRNELTTRDEASAGDAKKKTASQFSILEQLSMLNKRKKFSREDGWEVISNISKYSSDHNKETEKKKILICLGNNNFGQLGFQENVKIGIVDFSTVVISKRYPANERSRQTGGDETIACETIGGNDGGSETVVEEAPNGEAKKTPERRKRYNDLAREIKRRNNNSSFYNCQSNNTLSKNEIYNDILTRLPNDFNISTIKKLKNDEKVGKSMSKGNVHDLLGNRPTTSGSGRKNRSVTSEEEMNNRNTQNGKRLIKEESRGKLFLRRKKDSIGNRRTGSVRISLSRGTNYLRRNRYKEGAMEEKKKRFFSENEKDKDYQRRIHQYSDFFKTSEYVIGGSGGSSALGGVRQSSQADIQRKVDMLKQMDTSNSPNSNRHLVDGGNKQGEDYLYFNPEIINCGKYHSGVVSENGFVCLWGLNCYGQLGTEKTVLSPYIHKLVPLKHFGYRHKVKDISLGSFHTLLLTYDGFVFTFGCNKKAQLGLPNGYHRKVSHTSRPFLLPLVVVERGMQNSHLRYGRTNTFFFSSKKTYANIAHPVISITCGAYNSALIDANRKLWIWGWNKFGQIDNSYALEKVKRKEREEAAQVCKTCSKGGKNISMMSLKRISEMVQKGGEHIKKKLTSKELHVEDEEMHKDKQGRYKKSNKLVNIPRNVKIKNKNVLQVSLGKYHSLCLTEDKSVYIWGYLKKKKKKKKAEEEENSCSYVMACCGGSEYYRNITIVTEITCLSNLYISSITSSSTHTAFVAPITYIDEKSVDSQGGPSSAISTGAEKVGDKFRYNILLKNDSSHLLEYYSEQVVTRGGDNIFYVKYGDLIHLISRPSQGGESHIAGEGTHPRENVYLINNSLHVSNVYNQESNYYLNFNARGGHTAAKTDEAAINRNADRVSKILQPLLLSNNNNLNRVDLLQIFQVAMGKNFAIFLTSSPSINRILNKKKIDYINNICSLDVLRNKIPERNIFIIGKSDFHHIILPSNCKQTSIPICLHKNKLINEVLLRNKKHNFLNISRRKKYSDQISYCNKLLNLKKLHGKIKKSVTNCSLLYNDIDQQRCPLMLDSTAGNRSSLTAYKLNSMNCSTSRSRSRKSISYVQSSSDRASSNNNNIFHFNLRKRRNRAVRDSRGKFTSSEDRFSGDRDGRSRVSSHVSSNQKGSSRVSSRVSSNQTHGNHVSGNRTDGKRDSFRTTPQPSQSSHQTYASMGRINLGTHGDANDSEVSNQERAPGGENKEKKESTPPICKEQKDNSFSSSNEGEIKKEHNSQNGAHLGMSNKESNLCDEPGEYYPIGKKKQASSAWDTQNGGKHFSHKSSSRSSSCNNNLSSGQEGGRANNAMVGSFSIVRRTKKAEMCREYTTDGKNNERDDQKESNNPPAKGRRKSSTCVNKKKLFRNMILQTIDNLSDNFLNQKNGCDRLLDCEQVKLKFKVFKRRRSCLWNYFTYHHTKRKCPLGFNLSENIVNTTLLDVACGDYHSLILLEVDTLT
ncbi:Uncharacterized protein PCOAH_00012230 [Plasmodium coatneyi]|uniref:Regulator of chromosome condensation n=1 Tax=Plasmodium coatneyi TaxID=208452 RepID=A0A1B1DVS8_9APIC|nr:Uncharacterized protein PCOAH_00012230 [Plasmodium coatneyi]ANQ06707.1 Uncharacterized protein PCOAH_00012230 [Plasmodium coatneyi]